MPIPNDLYRKNMGVPQVLPAEDYDDNGDKWTNLLKNELGRTLCGYTKAPPYPVSYNPDLHNVFWEPETESWRVEDKPPPIIEPVLRITHKQFLDLMTMEEQVKMRIKRKELDALTASEYAASLQWQAFSILLDQFDKSMMIELDNAQTIIGFNNILVPMGIFTAPRAARVLAGLPPEVES